MRVLVTGATGFVGRSLVPALREAGHEAVALVRPSTDTSGLAALGVDVLCDDGTSDLQPALARGRVFDGVIHLASKFLVAHAARDVAPLVTSNVMFPARLLDAAARSGVRWFLNTGTSWQHYEGHAYSPVNLYAATKQAFEAVARYYVEAHGLRFATLALGDTYGPGDSRPKLLNLWCRIANSGETLDMSEGLQRIDLAYITDVVAAYARLADLLNAEAWEGGMPTFSAETGEHLSLRELAALFERVTGRSLSIRWGLRPSRAREVMRPWYGGQRVPGWCPRVPLSEGLACLAGGGPGGAAAPSRRGDEA